MTMWMRLGGAMLGVLCVACGSEGEPGRPGLDGQSGRPSLIRFVEEPPGPHCPNGGTAMKSGLDADGNGNLEDSEATSTAYTCHGPPGGDAARTLMKLDPEPAGAHCAQGGTRVSSGLDANDNGTLDSTEVASTDYVCNGAEGNPGSPGAQALVRLDPETPGSNCVQGGTAVHSGLDTNGNGTLEASEVTQTRYVCSNLPLHATGWAASAPTYSSGDAPAWLWFPSGRKVSILKTSAASRLKITVSDNLGVGVGVNEGSGYYALRINGGYLSPNCHQRQYVWSANSWTNSYYFPFATVCLTDSLPAGLYEFETWGQTSAGTAHVGAGLSHPLVFVEELLPTAGYAASVTGGEFATSSTSFQKASGRTVNYTKQDQDTLLKVTLADTFRSAYNQNDGSGTLMVRMDGNNTSCFTGQHDSQGAGGNFHHPIVMTCVLPGVPAGAHTFDVWTRSDSARDTVLGWERSYPLLLVEEIANQNLSYINSSTASGELSSDWAAVGGRQVQHDVSAAGKAIRVTYSDTFRATQNCGGRWGYFQLYVDGRPTYCINAQYSYNSGSSAHNHHHPVNQTCLVRGLSPGPHTFAIWTSNRHAWDGSSCGTNHFGWNRGQNLLLVEELP